MGSNFYYSIDLNEDQNHQEQPFFYPLGSSSSLHHHHQVPSNSSSSSSSISSLSTYLPLLINSHDDQHVAYNNSYHVDHLHISQPLKAKMFVANGGSSSSSYDHMVPKNETKPKLTIRKKDHHEDQTDLLHQNPTKPYPDSDKWMISPKMRLIKKTISNKPIDHTHNNDNNNNNNNHKDKDHYPLNHKTNLDQDHDGDLQKVTTRKTPASTMENRYSTIKEHGYGNNNGVIRVCSDCNTTKTPLWRSGPRGPKSLCNACGIRQRKARRAAMAAAAAATGDQEVAVASRLQPLPLKKKLQNKKKRSNGGEKHNLSLPMAAKAKKFKIKQEEEEMAMVAINSENRRSTTSSSSSISSNILCFDDLTIMLSKSSAYNQKVFPQDEKEAAVLLMALSYGMVHG